MTRWVKFFASLFVVTLTASGLMQVPAPNASLARLIPAGPLLVLEAKNFAQLVSDWNGSEEKARWLESANFQAFLRSKLLLRLKDVQKEFAAAAGFTPDMSLVESISGTESVLALYDIGEVEFLYISEIASARRLENALWQTRANFEPRNAAGTPYYVRIDSQSGRVVAFAATDDYLLLATAEEPIAGALTLLAGSEAQAVTNDSWYRDAVQAAGARGELRMVLDMDAITKTPYFRSYWIQRNVSELSGYRAAVSDVHHSAEQVRERRVFLRREADQESRDPSSTALLLRLVTEEAGLYRAWADPTAEQAIALLEQKVLTRRRGPAPPPKAAPVFRLSSGRVGSEAALETRVDERPPAPVRATFAAQLLRNVLTDAGLKGMLHLQSSRPPGDGVFFGDESVVVLLAESPWEEDRIRRTLIDSVRSLWTVSSLGAEWRQQEGAGESYHVLDGERRLAVAVRGDHLFVSNATELLESVLAREGRAATGEGVTYAAGFRHAHERENYERFMGQLDSLAIRRYGTSANRPPQFFSENLGSLSETLRRVGEVSVEWRDQGETVSQVVTYELNQ